MWVLRDCTGVFDGGICIVRIPFSELANKKETSNLFRSEDFTQSKAHFLSIEYLR